MSEMTPCNHCTLQSMRRRAQERGVVVVLGRDEESGWVTARYDDEDEPCAWFVTLTDVCAC